MPEFAVGREVFMHFIEPPIGKTKFHDLVKRGLIVKVKELRGFFRLNESLRRLGLREVASLPKDIPKRSTEEILRLAFTAIDPLTFPQPSWADAAEGLDMNDVDHARLLFNLHREFVEELETPHERLHYFAGVLDHQRIMESEG